MENEIVIENVEVVKRGRGRPRKVQASEGNGKTEAEGFDGTIVTSEAAYVRVPVKRKVRKVKKVVKAKTKRRYTRKPKTLLTKIVAFVRRLRG